MAFALKLLSAHARMTQAAASSTAPAVSANVPTVVPAMPRSEMMRASTGKAVIDIAAPRNSAACTGVTRSVKNPPRPSISRASAAPSPKGTAIPAADRLNARRR